jgi:hypothetical protein
MKRAEAIPDYLRKDLGLSYSILLYYVGKSRGRSKDNYSYLRSGAAEQIALDAGQG